MQNTVKVIHILNTIDDMVSKFLFYDRKEDEILPLGAIEQAISAGEITKDEVIDAFAQALRRALGPN